MKSRAHILVNGRVQGVFFRDHTKKWAASLGLTGWVRNLSQGQVEILAEGEKSQIDLLIEQVKEGSPLSRVETVDVEWGAYSGDFEDFRITW